MTTKDIHVAVLYGGTSSEREVSLRSGAAVARSLTAAGCKVTEVDITGPGPDFVLPLDTHVVFPVLHGTFGEDGTLQQILEYKGVPYVGSGVMPSHNAFDKVRAKQIFLAEAIPTPVYEVLLRDETRCFFLKLPVFVKPARQGSSVGAHKISSEGEVNAALDDAFQYDDTVLVEECVIGRELTVGFLGSQPLPIVEIKPVEGWYDYNSKYTKGKTNYIAPAELSSEITRLVHSIARQAYLALGCRHFGRVDLILPETQCPQVLEVNTIPGFTDTSLLPKAVKAAGIEFESLCVRLVEMALGEQSAMRQEAKLKSV